MKRLLTIFSLWALFGAFVCQAEYSPTENNLVTTENDDRISRRDLAINLRQRKAMQIVYSNSMNAISSPYKPLVERLIKSLPEDWQLNANVETNIAENHLKDIPLVVLGRQFQNPALQVLLSSLPFQSFDSLFIFNDKKYDHPELSFRLFMYPNPKSKTPIFFIGGNSDEAIQKQITSNKENNWGSFFWQSWGYEIYDGTEVITRGNFRDKDWTFNPNNHFDFTEQSKHSFNSQHFQFHDMAGLGQTFIENLAKNCEAQLDSLRDFTGSQNKIEPIDYFLYPSIENKGLRLLNTQIGHFSKEEREVHVVINNIFSGQHTHQDLHLLLQDLLGKGSKAALDQGLAAHFNSNWQKNGANYWAARLYQSDNLPPLAEILDDQLFQQESPVVMIASGGSFVSFLIEKWGRQTFLANYKKWPSMDASDLDELEQGWHLYLKSLDIPLPPHSSPITPYYQGFNFAHEGYRIYNGYGSKLAQESLEKLSELGTNAVAIVPYGYMQNPRKASFIGMQHGAGSENDESVIFSHAQAKQLGMYTLMKPQLWINGSWPGDVAMSDDQSWDQFFDYYYRWIRHYALIAEIWEFDALCLGVEFSQATRTKPEAWRKLIGKLRGLYTGPITYAANWGEEFEQLSFWDELDFIGLNCYYPLSKEDQPRKEKLKKAFADVLQKAEIVSKKYNKPIVFTEVGFRSVSGSWKNPHAEADGRNYDAEAQQLCYEVLFEGIQDKEWVKGLYLWKWPSYLGYENGNPTSFTPSGKAAEEVVKQWFNKR